MLAVALEPPPGGPGPEGGGDGVALGSEEGVDVGGADGELGLVIVQPAPGGAVAVAAVEVVAVGAGPGEDEIESTGGGGREVEEGLSGAGERGPGEERGAEGGERAAEGALGVEELEDVTEAGVVELGRDVVEGGGRRRGGGGVGAGAPEGGEDLGGEPAPEAWRGGLPGEEGDEVDAALGEEEEGGGSGVYQAGGGGLEGGEVFAPEDVVVGALMHLLRPLCGDLADEALPFSVVAQRVARRSSGLP